MGTLTGKWEMITPKMNEGTEILDFKDDLTYQHRMVNGQEESACYFGTYELVPSTEETTEIILYPSEEQALFNPETHLYLQTHYLAKVESDTLTFLDIPGKSEQYLFKRIR